MKKAVLLGLVILSFAVFALSANAASKSELETYQQVQQGISDNYDFGGGSSNVDHGAGMQRTMDGMQNNLTYDERSEAEMLVDKGKGMLTLEEKGRYNALEVKMDNYGYSSFSSSEKAELEAFNQKIVGWLSPSEQRRLQELSAKANR